eukprot:scaffold74222_cov20-Tisochrysis_lutea.AAC.1
MQLHRLVLVAQLQPGQGSKPWQNTGSKVSVKAGDGKESSKMISEEGSTLLNTNIQNCVHATDGIACMYH